MSAFVAVHRKSITALIGAVLTWGSVAQVDGISATEYWGLAIALATAAGVYGVANVPDTEPDSGQSALVVVLIVILILILLGVVR